MQSTLRAHVPAPPAWLRRLGLGGFFFFLVKGLAWLTLPYVASVILN
jgi:hypothetical protein